MEANCKQTIFAFLASWDLQREARWEAAYFRESLEIAEKGALPAYSMFKTLLINKQHVSVPSTGQRRARFPAFSDDIDILAKHTSSEDKQSRNTVFEGFWSEM